MISESDYEAMLKRMWPGQDVQSQAAKAERSNRTKFGNRKTTIDGVTFDSAREAKRWQELVLLEKQHHIRELRRQIPYIVQDESECSQCGAKIRAVIYKADFTYIERNRRIVEDTKGFRTKEYALKRKLFLARYPEITFREVK